MAGKTTILRAGNSAQVLSMIEVNVEAIFELRRETLQRRIATLHIGVADKAHRNRGSDKLGQVAICAKLVAREAWNGGIVATAFMARSAGKGRMALALVNKFSVVEFRTLDHRIMRFTTETRRGRRRKP